MAASSTHSRIFSLAGTSAALGIAALLLPRFVPSSEGGLAAAATAVLVFFVLLGGAVAVALAGLAISLRAYATLSWPARAAGIGPALVFGTSLAWVILFLRLLSLAPGIGVAQPASDRQMAAEALAPYVPSEHAQKQYALERHRDRLTVVAQKSPEQVHAATAFFNRGLTGRELQLLAESTGLEVIDVHAKAPKGTEGTVTSVMFGMADLHVTDGGLAEKLSFAISAVQKCFEKSASVAPAEEAQEWADLASHQFLVYSARVFGSAKALQALQNTSDVTSVMLNVQQSVISEYEATTSVKEPHPFLMPGFLC